MSAAAGHDVEDGCGGFGPNQQWAVVWFFAIIAIGTGLFLTLRDTDAYNYANNGEFFNLQSYRDNRLSSTLVHGDNVDERQHGDLNSAVAKLAK